MNKVMALFIFLVSLLPGQSGIVAPETNTQADSLFEQLEKFCHTLRKDPQFGYASLSICLVQDNRILWKKAFGKADILNDIEATPEHLYNIGSVSKLITSACALKLCDDGKLSLDEDIDRYLPFSVRHPRYPDIPITLRMLLTHSTGLGSVQDLQDQLYASGDPEMPLADLCRSFFSQSGVYFKAENWNQIKPGTAHEYSNWNFVLVGYLVEHASKTPFYEFCRSAILTPLQMNHSGWLLKHLTKMKLVTLYKKKNDDFVPLTQFSWPGYPDGSMRCTMTDLAHFLIMIINKGRFNEKQILSQDRVAEMLRIQDVRRNDNRRQAICWTVPNLPKLMYYHDGSPSGTHSMMLYFPENRKGFAFTLTGLDMSDAGRHDFIDKLNLFLFTHFLQKPSVLISS